MRTLVKHSSACCIHACHMYSIASGTFLHKWHLYTLTSIAKLATHDSGVIDVLPKVTDCAPPVVGKYLHMAIAFKSAILKTHRDDKLAVCADYTSILTMYVIMGSPGVCRTVTQETLVATTNHVVQPDLL